VVPTVFVNRPSCPHHASPVADEDPFNDINIQSMDAIKTEGSYRYDEVECPNLNISIPTDISKRNNIPVTIYIHGLYNLFPLP
jgi:carboxylesterase type B